MFTIQRIIARKRLLAQMAREEERKKAEETARRAQAAMAKLEIKETVKKEKRKFPQRKDESRTRLNCLETQLFSQTRAVTISLTMSPLQAKALKVTWDKMKAVSQNTGKGNVTLVQRSFQKLEAKHDFVKLIFYKAAFNAPDNETATTIRDHANYMVIWIEGAIQRITDAYEKSATDKNMSFQKKRIQTQNVQFELLLPAGHKHCQLRGAGLQSKHFDELALNLIDQLYNVDSVRAYPEALRAWRILIATLFDNIIADFLRYRKPKIFAQRVKGDNKNYARRCPSSTQKPEVEINNNKPAVEFAAPEPWYKEWYV